MLAICINCGSKKTKPFRKCPSCSFVPSDDESQAKSLRLSEEYWLSNEERAPTRGELLLAAETILAGRNYTWNPDEIEALVREKNLLDKGLSKTDSLKIILFLLLLLAPGALGLYLFLK